MKKFKTESQKLLDLMINSIYTNKEIFLRELISNASDAVDKLHFKSLTDKSIDEKFEIFIKSDKKARTLTVSDNGIGMNKDELDKNLGTIAHSDSMNFKDKDEIDIIGQFGVGFYSVFMVADKVEVTSKAYGEKSAYVWKSDGVKGYTVDEGTRKSRGTDVLLHLKEGEEYDKFLEEYTLTDLIKRFSNYVRYPIKMEVTKSRKKDDSDEYEDYTEIDTVNSMVPIWKRKKSEVKKDEYAEFYKSNFHDFADPLMHFDIHAEGTLNYDALIYIPSVAPFDLYSKEYKKGLQLYTSNVLIMDKCEDLVPDYFNFLKGVVDSPDLTLNISRETLQQNSELAAIARRIEKRVNKELTKMCESKREDYETFFKNFGRVIKFGIYSTYGAKKDDLADLLLFYSARNKKMVTLKEFVKDKPKYIYYAAGTDTNQLAKMPAVTTLQNKDIDVLLLTEDIDEFCIQAMMNYDDIEFKNVASGDLDIDSEEDKKKTEKLNKDNEKLFKKMKKVIGVDVKITNRVTDAPACISAEGPVSFEMERVMAETPGANDVTATRVLELNPKHKVFKVLKEADDKKLKLYSQLLYDQACLVEGLPISDPVEYAKNVSKLMV
ncbi:MAG: molecular chaperone HtpG [Coriobacteriia bacterium]|nr:molecular chaperone HtpG [Coriobacteriia bacterium]